jgi:hypothetical protein
MRTEYTVTSSSPAATRARGAELKQRTAGIAAITGAVLAIVGNAALFVVHPVVPKDKLSWPLSPHSYVFVQLFFALTQALFALGIIGMVRSGIVRPGRWARVFGILAIIGVTLTVPGELVLIAGRHDDATASAVNQLSTVFGLGALLSDAGLIGLGVLALRQRRWPRGWVALPLALGAFQLLVVTPVSFAAGFTSVASNVAIGIADALTALIGIRLLHPTDSDVPRSAAASTPPSRSPAPTAR